MKKFTVIILSLIVILGLIGCNNINSDKDVQVFKTENIKRILFYNDTTLEEVEVPEEYLEEITTWLESFTIDKEVENDHLEPGSDAYCVQIEYEDGTIVKNGLSIFEIDGKQYYIKGADTPECWQDIFENQFHYPLGIEEYKNSFVGKVVEETTSYMIVEPIEDKADGDMGEKVKVEYGTHHYDYLFGEGRMVVIYFEGKPEETNDGMKLVKSDDISTEGFREFELEVEPSSEKQKRLALSGDDIQSFVSFGHMSDTNLYYYGLDKVMITIKGFTMPLETALEKGRITLDGIVANCNMDVMNGVLEELVYKDGGSQVYKYPEYTIIKYHTLDGNRDVYIGSTDMDIQIANK